MKLKINWQKKSLKKYGLYNGNVYQMNNTTEKTAAQSQLLANRLQKRFRHLKKWAQRTGAGVFRLYDRDIPEIPLVLDFYGDCAQPLNAALSGALYKRPYEKDEDDEERWLLAMKDSAAGALGIDRERIFLKQRQKQKGASQYEKINTARFTKTVNEGDLSFKVNLSDYLDTGLFPDRRLLRAMIRGECEGKKLLNLFSYTGLFSVYAAAGGAASTDSADMSNTYCDWARENFSLNNITAEIMQQWDFFSGKRACANKIIRADVLDFLEKAAAVKMRWDIIVLDPPAFSNSKKMTASFDLRRDITGLVSRCLNLLAPGGKLFLSINTRRSVTAQELEDEFKGAHVLDLGKKLIDEDFKGRKMPDTYLIEI